MAISEVLPFVSVIIPARNEERYIGNCLAALAAQSYPPDRMEVLIADGLSSDRTREIVREFVTRDPRVRMLDNPSGRTPTALNTALEAARGSVICRMDAHAVAEPDYVAQCVSVLQETAAWCVGGRMEKVGGSPMAAAIAAATTSRFGVGDSSFHYATHSQAVESVYLGCWPRAVFDTVGFFNQELVRNQDDELSYRIREAGGTIWFDPRIHVRYHGRDTLGGLFRQYREYGFWKVRVFRAHPKAVRWRHLVPAALVGTVAAGAATTPLLKPAGVVAVAAAAVYGAGALLAASSLARRHPGLQRRQLVGAFACMHLGYGAGFWQGIAAAVVRQPWTRRASTDRVSQASLQARRERE